MNEREWLACEDPARMLVWATSDGSGPGEGPNRLPVSDRKLRLFAVACYRALPGYGEWDAGGDARFVVEAAEALADGLPLPLRRGETVDSGAELHRLAAEIMCYCGLEDVAAAATRTARGPINLPPARVADLLREVVGNPFRPGPDRWRKACRCDTSRQFADRVLDDRVSPPRCTACEEAWKPADWLTPTVLSLAAAAYEERPARQCETCDGKGRFQRAASACECNHCHGTGRIEDGILDPANLAVLSDALEEAGCAGEPCDECGGRGWLPDIPPVFALNYNLLKRKTCGACGGAGRTPHTLLEHLRSPGPHVRGCWAIDRILGKE